MDCHVILLVASQTDDRRPWIAFFHDYVECVQHRFDGQFEKWVMFFVSDDFVPDFVRQLSAF